MSRNGVKATAKKGGAGGKGTWGVGGIGDLKSVRTDEKDPNYDSESDNEAEADNEWGFKKLEVENPIQIILQEYYSSADIKEFVDNFRECLGQNKIASKPNFLKKALISAMEHHAYERELVSRLLVEIQMVNGLYSPADFMNGFAEAYDNIDDIVLDTPDAVELLAKFTARAIVDEVIPPAFLKNFKPASRRSEETIKMANGIVTEPHRSSRLEHIWGAGDLRSINRLKKEVDMIVKEYFETKDTSFAAKTLHDLHAPSFHFQFVKRAVFIALSSPKHIDDMVTLIEGLSKAGDLSKQTIGKGFTLCAANIDDLALDVPSAKQDFSKVVAIFREKKLLDPKS